MTHSYKPLTLWISCMLISILSFAQNTTPTNSDPSRSCNTDDIHQEKMQNNPVYRKHFLAKQEQLRNSLQQRSSVLCANPIKIPVAVHFQNATNPDVACLRALAEDQIQILNDDFQGLNSDINLWTGTAAAFFPGVSNGETCIEFCLATNYHPTGYGIVDGDPAVTINQGNDDFDAAWSGYLNVWVRNIGALGYSPLGGDGDGDGVTIDNAAFGSGAGCSGFVPGAPYHLGRTLTHELGHYFDLPHIWGGGCGNDDGVADTPDSQSSYGGCPNNGVSSCGSTDMHMNYMDYVNDLCMYMFSAGQSTRMENYVDNFLDIIVNNDTVCTGVQPRIQFTSASSSVLEGTSSCNISSSQVIPVNLSIATAPSANAVVTFLTAGTASNGTDYSISPSSVTFTTGLAATQTVNITINEDAYVESLEDIQITYIINPNGGDAIAGSSNQMYTISITDDDSEPTNGMVTLIDENFNAGSTGWTINDGGSTTDTWSLSTGLNGNSNNSIDGTQFMLVNSDDAGNGSTSDEELISPVLNTQGMTAVMLDFTQYINVYNQGGFETFDVDIWNGSAWLNVYSRDEDDGDLGSWNNPNQASIDITAHANSQMQVRFKYTSGYDWWWAIDNVKVTANAVVGIQTDSNSGAGSAEHELGAFQTVHFYDQNTGNIMMTIENTSGHDYGCTYVEVDQSAGNNPGAVMSNAPEADFVTNRSLRVIPTNNNPAGTYNLSLYYTEEEINGWAAASGNPASDLEIVKSSTDIATATFLELLPPIVTSFNSDFIYTTSISTGFSGFALGNPTSSLPVELLAFDAKAKEKTIQVNWTSTSELENRGFELLRSTHPDNGFTAIAWIAGSGTTNQNVDYHFEDTKVQSNIDYYYQLRQVDFDGTPTLSRIVSARLTGGPSGFSIYPNPVQAKLRIDFEQVQNTGTLRVIDMLGQNVLNQVIRETSFIDLQVGHLPKGVYWLEFDQGNNDRVVHKFLKLE